MMLHPLMHWDTILKYGQEPGILRQESLLSPGKNVTLNGHKEIQKAVKKHLIFHLSYKLLVLSKTLFKVLHIYF